jgi:hypothetical protein
VTGIQSESLTYVLYKIAILCLETYLKGQNVDIHRVATYAAYF